MGKPIIEVKDIAKQYRLGQLQGYKTFRDTIANFFRRSETNKNVEYIWALENVSFNVEAGDVIGIIGANGAGKTTLLKLLSRITEPTKGQIILRGRIASLLEVGTGFHPELTGRENIFLNGAILGMKRTEICKKFDEIVSFAEVEKFIDTPVKRYSSGMYVRLAFAVAAHLEPEILIVDEVLAVGDLAFQKKCMGKMSDVARAGRTILFVSHNMGAVRALCEKGILIHNGKLIESGVIGTVIDSYMSKLITNNNENFGFIEWNFNDAPGGGGFRLTRIELMSHNEKISGVFSPQQPFKIRIYYTLDKPIHGMRIIFQLVARSGEIVFASTDHQKRSLEFCEAGKYISICYIPGSLLNISDYSIRIGAGIPGIMNLLKPVEFLKFSVTGLVNNGSIYIDNQKWPGVVCPELKWEIIKNGAYYNVNRKDDSTSFSKIAQENFKAA